MITINISTIQTIKFLEGKASLQEYFKDIPVLEFWNAAKNGKTVHFNFVDKKFSYFNYKFLYTVLSKIVKDEISSKQVKLLFEVISLLEDEWDFEDGTLEEVAFFCQFDFENLRVI